MENKNKHHPPMDKFCPVCAVGNIDSHNILICDTCKDEFISSEEREFHKRPFDDGDIKDFGGFVNLNF